MPKKLSPRLFNLISWLVTLVVVFSLLGVTIWNLDPFAEPESPTLIPTSTELPNGQPSGLPELPTGTPYAILRDVSLDTNIQAHPNYDVIEYVVGRGDSVFSIARSFNIKPETLLWANYETLRDSPDSIRIGQVLKIPPVDGVYYQWQQGDTLESVAYEFDVTVEDILNWPGNNIDLSDPTIKPGTYLMVKDGVKEMVQWIIPDVARGHSGTANTGGGASCDGAYGTGFFVWPADSHYLSGNDYWSGHLGVDIAAGDGAAVYAADSGVVTVASGNGSWNWGYGNYIQVDHGNGYITLYAHLSAVNVSVCQSVVQGQLIGRAGNTGNSFGAHLHFEVRLNGGFVNPWYVLP